MLTGRTLFLTPKQQCQSTEGQKRNETGAELSRYRSAWLKLESISTAERLLHEMITAVRT